MYSHVADPHECQQRGGGARRVAVERQRGGEQRDLRKK